MANERTYNDPAGGSASEVGTQMNTFFYQKKALIDIRKEQYFSQLADVTAMPKNMGKKIKRFQYIPLLDDANLNDQGLDAAGVTILGTQYYVSFPAVVAVANAGKAAAVSAINDNINNGGSAETVATAGADSSAYSGFALITMTKSVVKYLNTTKRDAVLALDVGAIAQQGSGNLYGSSKDVGLINGKMPLLSETGGRVNRVGFKRKELEGSFEKFGFFDEYTQESLDFDSDADLMEHINRELINGANEITEDALQIDLLSAAGTIRLAGAAASVSALNATIVTYADLLKLSVDLDNNRTPKHTKVITGTRMVDTKTVPACRVMYIGSELIRTIRGMTDLFSNAAFIPVQQYAAGTDVLTGEIGSVDNFRIVVVPEMMKWAGAGALLGGNTTCHASDGHFDVFPMLVVGSESFTTIGFQTDGKSTKFTTYHKKPGIETADRNDPYGETGFMSIKWYYGFMALRPERIAVVKTAALI